MKRTRCDADARSSDARNARDECGPGVRGEGTTEFGCSPPWAPNLIYAASPQEADEYRKMGYTCRPAPRPEEL